MLSRPLLPRFVSNFSSRSVALGEVFDRAEKTGPDELAANAWRETPGVFAFYAYFCRLFHNSARFRPSLKFAKKLGVRV